MGRWAYKPSTQQDDGEYLFNIINQSEWSSLESINEWANKPLTLSVRTGKEKYLAQWKKGLSVQEKHLFENGMRLTLTDRVQRLNQIPEDDKKELGLRFSDELTDNGGDNPSYRARRASKLKVVKKTWDSTFILCFLWKNTHPLWCDLLMDGLRNGVNVCYNGPRKGSAYRANHPSARKNMDQVTKILEKQMAQGWLVGWFKKPPFINLRISPLGAIPKGLPEDGKVRIICDRKAQPVTRGMKPIKDDTTKLRLDMGNAFEDFKADFIKAPLGVG